MKARKLVYFLPFLVVILLSPFFVEKAHCADDVQIALYAFSNIASETSLYNNHPSANAYPSAKSQSFTLVVDAYYITEVTVSMRRVGNPDGQITMSINGGTYPNGTVLEESTTVYDTIDLALVATNYTFQFSQSVQLYSAETINFMLFIENGTLLDSSNRVDIGADNSNPYYTGGSMTQYINSGWSAISNTDMVFEIWGNVDELLAPTPTPTAPPNDWYDEAYMAQIASYVVILALIFIPVGILAKTANLGVVGALIGLAIGTGLSYLLFPTLVPIWLVFLVAMGIVALLYKQVQR